MLNTDIMVHVKGLESVKAEAVKRGFKKGNSGKGTMPCPVPGCIGQVTFAIAGSNGHIRAACTAAGCMHWVE